MQPTNSLRPIILNNASSLRITATAGTKLVGTSSLCQALSSITKKFYSRFSKNQIFFAFFIYAILLDQAFAHCPKFPTDGLKLRPCLSPNVVEYPLRSTKDHRLGRLLPHQQPNPVQAHLQAVFNLLISVFVYF